MVAGPPPLISSVGHGARRIQEFLDILTSFEVGHLVDVRTAPGSRRHPQFGRDELAASLRSVGIDYAWRKDLGGFRTPTPNSRHAAMRNESFRGYADYMDGPEFDAAFQWLEETARRDHTAFMCAESLWWRCHRRMIADALQTRGWTVRHLMAPGQARPHRLHPAARLVGTEVVYDVGEPLQETLPT